MFNLSTIRKKSDPEVIVMVGNKPIEPQTHVMPVFPEKISFEGSEFRIAWLRHSGSDYSRVNRLMSRCVAAGLRVQLFEGNDMTANIAHNREFILQADMVLLEAFGRTAHDSHATLLSYVRQYSIAPIAVLTEDSSAENAVSALRAGADAVVLLNMPEEVIIARFHSLLRRWFQWKPLSTSSSR